ncbi:MAG TPA: helix-turn-helix domain-containing protein [Trebonia sp.]
MSVGEELAEARSRAGLSVDQLSERTRIRKAVIRSIESDDFDACGGDLFVRGYVRALASAVGVDPRPLIREYNRAHVDTGDPQVSHVTRVADPVPPAADPGATSVDIPAVDAAPEPTAAYPLPSTDAAAPHDAAVSHDTAAADPEPSAAGPEVVADPAAPEMTVADLPAVSEDPTPTVDDLPVVPPPPPPHPNMPSTWVAESPGRPARPRHPRGPQHPRGRRERRGSARVWVPAVLVLAVAGVATGLALSSQSGPSAKNPAAFSQPSKSASPATAAPKTAAPSTANTPSPAQAAPAPVRSLHIAAVEAFGPNGLADGDNPDGAMSVIRHSSQSPWQSQWYATAAFGNLKDGTGLLIDMGHRVTVTSVRINMAGYHGANLQLRVGDSAGSPSSLRVAAHKSGAGGTVRVTLSTPQHVRYLLIWFTQLPPDGAGTYQATVYHVVVNGR